MNQTELADILYETAKDTKQHILQIITPSDFDFRSFSDILNSLLKVGHALPLSAEIDNLSQTLTQTMFSDSISDEDFICFKEHYIQTLDTIIYETILHRKKFCIIRRNDPIPGLASHIITNLGQIAACLKDGYIPIIDMQFSSNMFSSLSKDQTENTWELFFKQPLADFSLHSALSSNICIQKDGIPSFMPSYNMDCLSNPNLMNFWRKIMKQYMPFSDMMNEHIQTTLKNIPFYGNKVLGVLCRGTDYLSLRPYNHPVQPECHEVLKETLQIMKQQHCDYCYLATEDQKILNLFSESLGEKLLTSQKMYFSHEQQELLSNVYKDDPSQLLTKNVEYLTSLYILSQCSCLLAGRTSGLIVSLLLNQTPYDYLHIWNEGRYGIDDTQTLHSFL